jgi:hypothetical protein
MATIEHSPFEVSDLVRILKGVDPTALLVPARVLRRVIKHDRPIGGMGLLVPHRKSCVIDRETLLRIADYDELGVSPDEALPSKLILLVLPEPDRLARLPVEQALFKYWRMLFHARLDLAMQEKLADGTLNAQTVRQRIQRLGVTEFDEIAFVMRQEKFLLPPETPASIYAEFVAVYLTLRYFTKSLLPHFFPCIDDFEAVDNLVDAEVDADGIFNTTRPPGAPEPASQRPRITQTDGVSNLQPGPIDLEPAPPVGDQTLRWLEAKAQMMDVKGNNVRAAILRNQGAEGKGRPPTGARTELKRLSQRLQKALELSEVDAEKWRQALLPLLGRASRGSWSQEARFLYDLQKVCVDSEKGIFTIDPVEWLLSFGRRPLKRSLPGHQAVAIVRHLRQVLDRMRHVRLANGEREALVALLLHAVEHRERLMREGLRPLLAGAMNEVGLKPQNVPEELGRAKLIEELLDRVVDFGHLNMGNLRDAISRNQLKLPDLRNPLELASGDPLIRLNRRLGLTLDGVYRRGEIYMRLLHRISSMAFGTAIGRLLTLFLVVPFGLGFFTMVAPGLVIEEVPRLGRVIGRLVGLVEGREVRPTVVVSTVGLLVSPQGGQGPLLGSSALLAERASREHHGLEMPNLWGVALFGVFYLLLLHVGSFRSGFLYGVGKVGQGFQTVFITGPLWVLHLPALQALFKDRFWEAFRRCFFWPLILATLGGWVGWQYDLEPMALAWVSSSSWLTTIVLLNSRLGRDIEESVTDWLMYIWLWFSIDFLPGLLRLIMDQSRRFLEAVEQVIYTVDEWLRFKTGESLLLLGSKAILSVVWFAVTYIVRIYINLLIEPTVNPIKHFPVVTVGHKVMLPFLRPLARFLYHDLGLDVLGPFFGYGFVGLTIFFLPGICGFVVWELKENWRLYRANRPRILQPQVIGSHGESMLRLLKPGFHSGTVPKLYRKLRRAERRGQERTTRKVLGGLHHVEENVGHFIERELLALLRQSKGWTGVAIELTAVHLATNRVAVDLSCPALGPNPLRLGIDHQTGWLVAGVLDRGWLPRLSGEQRKTLAAALAGVYAMAGVRLTREQIAQSLAPVPALFDITEAGLVVWPGPDFTAEAVYDLSTGPILEPHSTNGPLPNGLLPPLDAARVFFTSKPVSWHDWVRTWQRDKGLIQGDGRELAYALLP